MPNLRIKVQNQQIEGQVEQMHGPHCEQLVQELLQRLAVSGTQLERRAEYYEQGQSQTSELTQQQ